MLRENRALGKETNCRHALEKENTLIQKNE
jgi:hypothetical protein